MRIAIISTGLFTGGFTNSLLAMARELLNHKVSVDFVMLTNKGNPLPADLATQCSVTTLNPKKSGWKYKLYQLSPLSQKIRFSHKAIQQRQIATINRIKTDYDYLDLMSYDAVISWEEMACNTFLALKVKAKRKLGYIHPDYLGAGYSPEADLPILQQLDNVIAVSMSTRDTLVRVFPELKNKIVCVPNVLNVRAIRAQGNETNPYKRNGFQLVTVCRLSSQTKGLERLLRVAKRLKEASYQYTWTLVGDGEDRQSLEAIAKKEGLTEIQFVGNKENPYPYVKHADLFALLSNYEGRPLVVDEAILLGTPVVVTEYTAAKEQVTSENGWVVPMNEEAIFDQIRSCIENPERLKEKRDNLASFDASRYTKIDSMMKVLRGE